MAAVAAATATPSLATAVLFRFPRVTRRLRHVAPGTPPLCPPDCRHAAAPPPPRRGNARGVSSSAEAITVRLVSINDVYDLRKLPRLATLIRSLGRKATPPAQRGNPAVGTGRPDYDDTMRPSAVTLCGDFLSPSALSSIDGGVGAVAAIRAAGITHVSLGNHEADPPLDTLKSAATSFQRRGRVVVLNSNVRGLGRHSCAVDVVASRCGRIRVGLAGLLSDERGMFRDGTFRGLTIDSVGDTWEALHERYVEREHSADLLVPLTHQSLEADIAFSRRMSKVKVDGGASGGVILGGHEHVKIHAHEAGVQIVKTGQNCDRAAIVDLRFRAADGRLESTAVHFEELDERYPPCPVAQAVVRKHLSVLDRLQDYTLFDARTMLAEHFVDPDAAAGGAPLALSSERTRFEQTTVGAVFCTAIKAELGTDHCIVNGAPIKANRIYPQGTMSYGELTKELPFPLKMVVVAMTRKQLRDAIAFSRTNVEEGKGATVLDDGRIERRSYLQVDFDYWRRDGSGEEGSGAADDEILTVALPRNLLKGFCKIQPLMNLHEELEASGNLPDKDDYIKAVDLIVRHCCKSRWTHIAEQISFAKLDLNNDGVLSREEISAAITMFTDAEPSDTLLDGMVEAIDCDANGVIDEIEFNQMVSRLKDRS